VSRTPLAPRITALLLLALAARGAAQETTTDVIPPSPLTAPHLVLKGFGDVNFRLMRDGKLDATRDTFSLGQLDLFFASELAEHVSVLSEIVWTFRRTNDTAVDVERIHITYELSDALNIRAGRMHLPLGYWNQTYHHGSWFQTTAARPDIYTFNSLGGPLPAHAIGFALFGTVPIPRAVDVLYSVMVGNGRGRTLTETQNVTDANQLKAVDVLLAFLPEGVPGLRFGGVVYIDRIPNNAPSRPNELKERLTGGHVVYIRGNAEFLAEYINMRHEDAGTGRVYKNEGGYVQAAWEFGKIKPYYRFDYLEEDLADVFLGPTDHILRRNTFGVRWDPISWNGIKLEYSYANRDGALDHGMVLQTAFTF
jgi:hypothetical protein